MFIKKFFQHKNSLKYLTFLIIAIFLIISFYVSQLVGLHYDEALYANTLFGCKTPGLFDEFVIKTFGVCIPILVMGYIGALKTYILLPLTPFFTDNNALLLYRSVSIIFGAFSIYLLFLINKSLKVNPLINFFATFVMSFNLSFIFGVTFDWGPSSISIFLKSLFLLILVKVIYVKNYKTYLKLIFTLLLIAILGTFNKLDFVFFVFAFLLPLLFLKNTKILLNVLIKNWLKLVLLLTPVVMAGVFILYSIRSKIVLFLNSDAIPVTTLNEKLQVFRQVFWGKSVTKVITNQYVTNPLLTVCATILGLILIFVFLQYLKGNLKITKQHKLLILSSVLYYAIIFSFKKSGGPQHFIPSFPVIYLLLALIINPVKDKVLSYLIIFFSIFYIGYMAIIFNQSVKIFKNQQTYSSWSVAQIDLANYLVKNHKQKTIYVTDWGVANQLIILSKGKLNVVESFRPISQLNNPKIIEKIKNTNTKNSVAIKPAGESVFKLATDAFPYNNYKNTKTIKTKKGEVFIVYY